jgi:hypothetical protein
MPTARSVRFVCASLLASAWIVALAPSAQACGWFFHGGTPHSVTHYNSGGGNFGGTATATRPNGQTATRTFSQRENNGTINDRRSPTGFNSRTTSSTVTRTPGQGVSATFTNRAGQTYNATTQMDPLGWR